MYSISHIGIYTRILLTLLLDKDARPPPRDMKLWVDALRFVKRGARGGALGFFTYMELSAYPPMSNIRFWAQLTSFLVVAYSDLVHHVPRPASGQAPVDVFRDAGVGRERQQGGQVNRLVNCKMGATEQKTIDISTSRSECTDT